MKLIRKAQLFFIKKKFFGAEKIMTKINLYQIIILIDLIIISSDDFQIIELCSCFVNLDSSFFIHEAIFL